MHSDDSDKINQLYGLTLDWSVVHAVKEHVKPFLNDRPTVRIAHAYLVMSSGKHYYARSAYNSAYSISAVNIKLTDNSVICVSLRHVYQVTNVFALCAHEEETMKSIGRSWYVYVVECSDASLYCGITIDVKRRVSEHNEGKRGSKYTRSRRPVKLLKYWKVDSQSDAMKAENRFKKLSREDKLKIVGDSK
jgi:putative endonuclease